MRRVQDQFLELPRVMEFAREHGEDVPLDQHRPSIAKIRAMIYPIWFWWFKEHVDNREV
jgi:hypothetical protein